MPKISPDSPTLRLVVARGCLLSPAGSAAARTARREAGRQRSRASKALGHGQQLVRARLTAIDRMSEAERLRLTVVELSNELEGLRTAMITRAVIEQAKGIIIAARRCTIDEAFAILVSQSQHANMKLRDVACRLAADLTGRTEEVDAARPRSSAPIPRSPDEKVVRPPQLTN